MATLIQDKKKGEDLELDGEMRQLSTQEQQPEQGLQGTGRTGTNWESPLPSSGMIWADDDDDDSPILYLFRKLQNKKSPLKLHVYTICTQMYDCIQVLSYM